MSTLTGLIGGGGGGDVVQSQIVGGTYFGGGSCLSGVVQLSVPTPFSTYNTILNISGSGYLWSILHQFSISQTHGLRIIIDGNTLIDGTVAHTTNSGYCQIWPPRFSTTTANVDVSSGLPASPLRFETSLQLQGYRSGGTGIFYVGYSLD